MFSVATCLSRVKETGARGDVRQYFVRNAVDTTYSTVSGDVHKEFASVIRFVTNDDYQVFSGEEQDTIWKCQVSYNEVKLIHLTSGLLKSASCRAFKDSARTTNFSCDSSIWMAISSSW
jgi:K+-transporting ATPase A subunit